MRKKGPPKFTGFYIPQYYRVKTREIEFCIGAAPRTASTSLHYFAQELGGRCERLEKTPDTAVCIIREPLARIASAYLLLPQNINSRDPVTNFKTIGRVAFEETIDAVLDDDGEEFFKAQVGDSAHAFAWQPQSELYNEVKHPIWIRLEGIGTIYGLSLPHENKASEPKPEVTYREAELKVFYAEDIEIWKLAATTLEEKET